MVGDQAERLPQRLGELAAGPVALLGGLRQPSRQYLVRRTGQALYPQAQRRRRLGHVRQQHRHSLVPFERRRAGQQLVRQAGQRVLIGPPVHRLAPDLLRRRVVRGTQELPRPGQAGRGHRPLAHPEVRKIHVIGLVLPRVHQDVRGLDIPVYQPRAVRGIQRRSHRRDELRGPARRQHALPGQHPSQVTARHEPHRDVQHPARLAGVVHRDDVRVIHRRRRPRLGDEPPPELLVHRHRRREDLQRHQAAQPLIAGPEDHREPACPDLRLQPVPRQQRARPEPGQIRREILAQQSSRPSVRQGRLSIWLTIFGRNRDTPGDSRGE